MKIRAAIISFFEILAFFMICLMTVKLGVQGVHQAPIIQTALTASSAIEMRSVGDVTDTSYLRTLNPAAVKEEIEEAAEVEDAEEPAESQAVQPSIVRAVNVVKEAGPGPEKKSSQNQSLPSLSLSVQAVFEKINRQAADFSEAAENPFTIQLVTYVNPLRAQEEVEHLNGMNFSAFIIPSGAYYQVCINRFFEKDQAVTALDELRHQELFYMYDDAFVRPILR